MIHCTRCKKDVSTYEDIQNGQEILNCSRCHKVLKRGATVGKKLCDQIHGAERLVGYSKVVGSAGYVDDKNITEGDLKRISVPPPSKCPSKTPKYESFFGGEQQLAAHCALIAGLREDEQAQEKAPAIFRSTIR